MCAEDNKSPPNTEYARLLFALNIPYADENINYINPVSKLLNVKMAYLSDCVRKEYTVVPYVLDAANNIGINPDYIKYGKMPVYTAGYAAPKHRLSKPDIVKKAPPTCKITYCQEECPAKQSLEQALRLISFCKGFCYRCEHQE